MENQKTIANEGTKKRSVGSSIVVGILGAISTAGILELIPDNIPFIGNLDEAAAAAMLISCLAYFGLDIGALFGRKTKKDDGVIDVEVEDR
jgi:aminopeptidase C